MFTCKNNTMTEALFQDLLKRQKESGLSIRDCCANEGITPSTFYYWLKKNKTKESQPKIFLPLTPGGAEQLTVHKKNRSLEYIPSASETGAPALLELVFPNGTFLKLNQVDMHLLQNLIHLYD